MPVRREQSTEEARVRIVRLVGEFDTRDAAALGERLDAAVSKGPARLVIDLKGVRFASAALLGRLLVARAKARRRGGDLVVSAPSRPVKAVLSVPGIERVLKVFPGDEEAVRHLLRDQRASSPWDPRRHELAG